MVSVNRTLRSLRLNTLCMHVSLVQSALADLDGDGDVDVVFAGLLFDGGALEWFENRGTESRWMQHDLGSLCASSPVRRLAVADLTNDGMSDVIAACQSAALITWCVDSGCCVRGRDCNW